MRSPAVLLFLTLFAVSCGSSDVSDSGGGNSMIPDGPLGAGPYPVATLDITVTHPDTGDISYTISCLGDTATLLGDVPLSAESACTALANADVRTRLIDGAPAEQICTKIYGGPDIATIVGTYDSDRVNTTVDRSNGCGIDDWERLFGGILPPATGI
ncbi:hypothetical protein [Ilumatobacter sp.]|uniref:hypothetical protein n=2 Tax=Ilumatobacter sp. TaxID=1967498 RepID=UPI003751289C